MRLIDADFTVYAAESEFSEEDASKVRWLISHIPTVDAELVRYGQWVPVDEEIPCDEWDCTACGERRTFAYPIDFNEMKELYKYCPNCGAKMK